MFDILDVAKRECKGDATKEEVALLHTPEMLPQWINALIAALNELDSQMTYHRDRITMLAEDVKLDIIDQDEYKHEKERFDSWQRKALRYKAGIQRRLNEVKTMMFSGENGSPRAEALIAAIMVHKQQCEASGLDPEPHDIDLWATIAIN